MDWKECLKKRLAKDIKKDDELIIALLKTSKNKLVSSDELKMGKKTANSKISLAYDSLREILEAIATINGYKIYNHECYTSFLKEILNKDTLGEEFDELRKIRNSINYYGKEISPEEAEDLIKQIKTLRERILKEFRLSKKE